MAVPLLSTVHVNVNCRDLERSLGFYRDALGLAPKTHTRPEPQDGAGFGLEGRVQWDAHLLHDPRGVSGPGVDLLQWLRPAPVGRPPGAANHLGIFRVGLGHPDLDALHARLAGAGVPTLSPPTEMPLDSTGGLAVRFFCALDPDGACVELREESGEPRLLHANVNCRDLDRAADWYGRVLGLEPRSARAEPGPCDGRGLGLPERCRFRADTLAVPGAAVDLALLLQEWIHPAPVGEPAREANRLGWFRIAWLVEDASAACAELDRLGVSHSGPRRLDMGPDVPVEALRAVFLRDPDGTCLELIERPRT